MKRYRQIPNVFNKEQVYKLFDTINDPQIMMASMLALFCGLRIGEIIKLRYEDIDLVRKQLKVINGKLPGKTLAGYGKDRTVPVPTQIIPLIVIWKNMNLTQTYLFPSLTKGDQPMTTQHIFKGYKNFLKKAGLIVFNKLNSVGHKKNLYTFHTLRHTYATLLWERTGDIYAVKKALGHANLETTLIYTHISDTALQNKVNSAFDIPIMHRQPNIQAEQIMTNMQEKMMPELAIIQQMQSNPIEILKTRLAKGEIKLEDFRQLRSELIVTPDTNYFG